MTEAQLVQVFIFRYSVVNIAILFIHTAPFIKSFSFLVYTNKSVNTTEGRTWLNVGWVLYNRKMNFDTSPLTYWREKAAAAAMRHTVLYIARFNNSSVEMLTWSECILLRLSMTYFFYIYHFYMLDLSFLWVKYGTFATFAKTMSYDLVQKDRAAWLLAVPMVS